MHGAASTSPAPNVTGANRILILLIAAPLLLLAGAVTLFLLKKVKKRGEKRQKSFYPQNPLRLFPKGGKVGQKSNI